MKLKIAFTLTLSLVLLSVVALYFFFTSKNGLESNQYFVVGFLSLAFALILYPAEPNILANPKGLRVRYYNLLTK